MTNPVAEIIARTLPALEPDMRARLTAAHTIIAALEGAGAKVLFREPTTEMNCAAWSLVRERWPKGQFMGPGPAFKEAMQAMWSTAPSWARNEREEKERP